MAIIERRFAIHPRRAVAVRVKVVRAVRAWVREIQQVAAGQISGAVDNRHS